MRLPAAIIELACSSTSVKLTKNQIVFDEMKLLSLGLYDDIFGISDLLDSIDENLTQFITPNIHCKDLLRKTIMTISTTT